MEHVKVTMTTTPVIAADHIKERTVKVIIYLLPHFFNFGNIYIKKSSRYASTGENLAYLFSIALILT